MTWDDIMSTWPQEAREIFESHHIPRARAVFEDVGIAALPEGSVWKLAFLLAAREADSEAVKQLPPLDVAFTSDEVNSRQMGENLPPVDDSFDTMGR